MQPSSLEFSADTYSVEVAENMIGTRDLIVMPVVGHVLNEDLIFRILNPMKWFTIRSTSGVVSTVGRPFDREACATYRLIIEV